MRLVLLLAFVASASPLSAQTAQVAESTKADSPKSEDAKKRNDKVICKSVPDTGSRVRRSRVCMTRWETKLQEDRARNDVGRIRQVSQPQGGPQPF